ncbi:hypothetical protein [Flavobacterium flavigenum]|uniref:hypothetical protein n=1 Tax=Flavobacterium flavigenum TaxID=3003258 RepID=UPI0022AC87DB|nr:hypothetical protein [Flavobacterium flavigenum]
MKLKLLLIINLFFVNSLLIAQYTNTTFGYSSNDGGEYNSFYGAYTGYSNTTGKDGVFVGFKTGYSNTSGEKNTFIGRQAGYFNTMGGYNVFSGYNSGYQNTTGSNNAFYGTKSGLGNTTGWENVFTGHESGQGNTTGYRNVFVGCGSGRGNNTGSNNVFIGYESGQSNQTGSYNVFTGDDTGLQNKGHGNIFTGRQAGYRNTTGNYNLYLGYKAGYSNNSGSYNIFIGHRAGENETTSNRLYIDNSPTTIPLIYGKFDTDQVGINTNVIPAGYAMAVKGKFITEEVKVQTYANWPDFVFKKEYNLPSINEVEQHIKKKGHLPNIPSASEVSENGILLGEMNAKLLQKIEELTLYIIQQEKRFNDQEARLKKLEAEMSSK